MSLVSFAPPPCLSGRAGSHRFWCSPPGSSGCLRPVAGWRVCSHVLAAVMSPVQAYCSASCGRRRLPPPGLLAESDEPEPQLLRLPGQGRAVSVRRASGSTSGVSRTNGNLAPDLVLSRALGRQDRQAGVLRTADPVLAAAPATVLRFFLGELAGRRWRRQWTCGPFCPGATRVASAPEPVTGQ